MTPYFPLDRFFRVTLIGANDLEIEVDYNPAHDLVKIRNEHKVYDLANGILTDTSKGTPALLELSSSRCHEIADRYRPTKDVLEAALYENLLQTHLPLRQEGSRGYDVGILADSRNAHSWASNRDALLKGGYTALVEKLDAGLAARLEESLSLHLCEGVFHHCERVHELNNCLRRWVDARHFLLPFSVYSATITTVDALCRKHLPALYCKQIQETYFVYASERSGDRDANPVARTHEWTTTRNLLHKAGYDDIFNAIIAACHTAGIADQLPKLSD